MDFFARQDQARRNTKLLVGYFVLAVACIIASVYFVCLLIFGAAAANHPRGGPAQFVLWQSDIFFYSSMGTLAVIVFGSLYQISALSSGGSAVAESLGGRLVNPGSTDPQERKLLNIVEEMSIASGVPMPKVYVLDQESGINAFAAGHSTTDAAVAVTRGCIQTLNRDELQGVIGHEFSHILNGDMRLNLQLMGIIFGIICLATVGRILLRTRGRKNPLPLLGLALILIGAVGVFFGRLIQAAVSRQREFLADAASVQFTRNPLGLSSALQKIASVGSRLQSERAADACHLFFSNGLRSSFLGMFATHPPLEARIRAIDPSWDGELKEVRVADEEAAIADVLRKPKRAPTPPVVPFPIGQAAGFAPTVVRAHTVLPNLGQPTTMHLRYAEQLRASFPEKLQAATRDPLAAQALVFALLLSDDNATRDRQLQEIGRQMSQSIREKTAAMRSDVADLAAGARLPLVNLLLPALRLLRPDEFQRLRDAVKWLVESDEQIDLFEFMLLKILQRNLAPQSAAARRQVAQFYSMKPLAPDGVVLLSALAGVSSADEAEVARAFQAGAPYLRAGEVDVTLLPRDQAGLDKVSTALDRLALAVPQIKKNILEACVRVVGADGVIQESEAELLRAISETLECPMPPFVEFA